MPNLNRPADIDSLVGFSIKGPHRRYISLPPSSSQDNATPSYTSLTPLIPFVPRAALLLGSVDRYTPNTGLGHRHHYVFRALTVLSFNSQASTSHHYQWYVQPSPSLGKHPSCPAATASRQPPSPPMAGIPPLNPRDHPNRKAALLLPPLPSGVARSTICTT